MSAQGISRALDVGAPSIVLASSGNAAVSAAAYCAVAGLRCEVATYRDMPEPYVRALHRFGARRVVFERSMDRWEHVRQKVEREGERGLAIHYNKDRMNAGEVLAAVNAMGHGIVDVSTREADLEDVFVSLTSQAAA